MAVGRETVEVDEFQKGVVGAGGTSPRNAARDGLLVLPDAGLREHCPCRAVRRPSRITSTDEYA